MAMQPTPLGQVAPMTAPLTFDAAKLCSMRWKALTRWDQMLCQWMVPFTEKFKQETERLEDEASAAEADEDIPMAEVRNAAVVAMCHSFRLVGLNLVRELLQVGVACVLLRVDTEICRETVYLWDANLRLYGHYVCRAAARVGVSERVVQRLLGSPAVTEADLGYLRRDRSVAVAFVQSGQMHAIALVVEAAVRAGAVLWGVMKHRTNALSGGAVRPCQAGCMLMHAGLRMVGGLLCRATGTAAGLLHGGDASYICGMACGFVWDSVLFPKAAARLWPKHNVVLHHYKRFQHQWKQTHPGGGGARPKLTLQALCMLAAADPRFGQDLCAPEHRCGMSEEDARSLLRDAFTSEANAAGRATATVERFEAAVSTYWRWLDACALLRGRGGSAESLERQVNQDPELARYFHPVSAPPVVRALDIRDFCAAAAPLIGTDGSAGDAAELPVGSRVVVTGLASKPELNGRSGVVIENPAGAGKDRVGVAFDGEKFAIRPANLVLEK